MKPYTRPLQETFTSKATHQSWKDKETLRERHIEEHNLRCLGFLYNSTLKLVEASK